NLAGDHITWQQVGQNGKHVLFLKRTGRFYKRHKFTISGSRSMVDHSSLTNIGYLDKTMFDFLQLNTVPHMLYLPVLPTDKVQVPVFFLDEISGSIHALHEA